MSGRPLAPPNRMSPIQPAYVDGLTVYVSATCGLWTVGRPECRRTDTSIGSIAPIGARMHESQAARSLPLSRLVPEPRWF